LSPPQFPVHPLTPYFFTKHHHTHFLTRIFRSTSDRGLFPYYRYKLYCTLAPIPNPSWREQSYRLSHLSQPFWPMTPVGILQHILKTPVLISPRRFLIY
jgi:hypothetical protein